MAFSDLELKHCEKALAAFLERSRLPAHLRDQVDISYKITGHSVEIYEVRSGWQDPTKKMETPVAKATFVRTQDHWKVYWMRRDLKWHGYEPAPEVRTIEAFLDAVDRDEFGCFFG